MTKLLDDSWKSWAKENIELGVPRDTVFNTLANNSFDLNDIEKTLEKWKSNKLDNKISFNPLKGLPDIIYDKNELPHERRFIHRAKKIEVQDDLLDIWKLDNFLAKEKCEDLVEIIKSHSRKSEVSSTSRGESYVDDSVRTSTTCDLVKGELIDELNESMSSIIGIHKLFSEPAQGQYYKKSQEFKAHTDYFVPDTDEYKKFCEGWGQRTWTFMIYLNEVQSGGETKFTKVKTLDGKQLSFKPAIGRAVMWNNLYVNGEVNPNALHQGCPVTEGEKVIITRWFREKRKS